MTEEYLYIRASNNNPGFKKFIESLGGNPAALLRKLYGDKVDAQEKLNFVPWSTKIALYEGCSKDFNEPYFGMKWAMAMPKDFRSAGPNVFFVYISKNIEQFAKLAIEFQRLHTNAVSYSIHADKNEVTARMDFHPAATYSRQFSEHVMGVIVLMGQEFVPDFQIKSVQFQHSMPDDMSVYDQLFKCPVNFNCNENSMIIDREWFKVEKTATAHNALKPVLKTFIDWQVRKNLNDIETIANAMNMNPKKLQRLLHDEGTSYSAVLDGVRKNIARRLLKESDMTIMHIAQLLDYSSDKTFIAAFKRWFEMPPGQYRNLKRAT